MSVRAITEILCLVLLLSTAAVSSYTIQPPPIRKKNSKSKPSSSVSGKTKTTTKQKSEQPQYFGQQLAQQLADVNNVDDVNSSSSSSRSARRNLLLGGGACMCALCATYYTPPEHGDDEIWMLDKLEARIEKEQTKEARFARVMAGGMADYEAWDEVKSFKSKLFGEVKKGDTVIEIGVGSGPNLPYYGKRAKKVMAVEPNRMFDEYIYAAAAKSKSPLTIVPGKAEAIPVEDNSVDIVVGTMVLCSVTSVQQSLKEVFRVLKPGGKYLFTEHTKAPDDWHLLGLAQTLTEPMQLKLAEGCHLRRNPKPLVESVFSKENVDAKQFVLSNTGKAPPDWPPHFLLAPHYVGMATKRV